MKQQIRKFYGTLYMQYYHPKIVLASFHHCFAAILRAFYDQYHKYTSSTIPMDNVTYRKFLIRIARGIIHEINSRKI